MICFIFFFILREKYDISKKFSISITFIAVEIWNHKSLNGINFQPLNDEYVFLLWLVLRRKTYVFPQIKENFKEINLNQRFSYLFRYISLRKEKKFNQIFQINFPTAPGLVTKGLLFHRNIKIKDHISN